MIFEIAPACARNMIIYTSMVQSLQMSPVIPPGPSIDKVSHGTYTSEVGLSLSYNTAVYLEQFTERLNQYQ